MVGGKACGIADIRRWRALLVGLLLAVSLLTLAPGQALARQAEGTASGQLTVTVQDAGSGGQADGGSGKAAASSNKSGTATGDVAGLAIAGVLALAAGGAYVAVRSRRLAAARAEGGQAVPASAKDVIAVGAVAVLAAALLLGASAARASADDSADSAQAAASESAARAAVSGAIAVDSVGNVLTSNVEFSATAADDLTLAGLAVPSYGDAWVSDIDGAKVAAGDTAEGAFSIQSIPSDLLAAAVDAGGKTTVELTAAYTYDAADEYTLSFESNGGSSVESRQVAYGELAGESPTPQRSGYAFVGWYSDANLTQAWDFATSTMPYHDVTLYAKWVEGSDVVEVTFDSDGGTVCEKMSVAKGSTIDSLPIPERVGYDFTGWYDGDNLVDEQTTFDSDITLKAKWESGTTSYKVELYEQTEDGKDYYPEPTVSDLVEGATEETTSFEAPKIEGYTAQPFEQQTIAGDGSTTIKVYYDRMPCTVHFDVNGGTAVADMTVLHGAPAEPPEAPTREGYDFTGWYYDETCLLAVDWDGEVADSAASGLTLYAGWAAAGGDVAYTVELAFEQPDGTYLVDDAETYILHGLAGEWTEVAAKQFDGYTAQDVEQILLAALAADEPSVASLTAEQTVAEQPAVNKVTINYDLNRYTVTFKANGHGDDKTVEDVAFGSSLADKAPKLSAAGYSFAGWYTDEALTKPFDIKNDTMPDSDLTLYAKWDARSDTPYKIKLLLQNTDGSYREWATYNRVGTTGKVTGSPFLPTWPTKRHYCMPEPVQRKIIEGDGSTVVEYKYDLETVNVRICFHDGTPDQVQEILYGAKATEPAVSDAIASDGTYFDGWKCSLYVGRHYTEKDFSFSTPITDSFIVDVYSEVTIDAKRVKATESYWLAPARSMTTSNSSVQVSNSSYSSPEKGITKSCRQIQADVKKIAAGDAATIAEYTAYMKNDNYHLYTKVGSGTSDNDYAEFRIINVGSHDGDGSALTFQAVSALGESMMNFNRLTAEGGWGATDLRTSMNSGDIYKKFASKFTSDIMPVAKTSLVSNTGWSFATSQSTTFDKLWLPSYSEMFSDASATGETRDAHDAQYAYEGSQYAYYTQMGLKGSDRNAALRQLSCYRDGSSDSGKDATWLRTTKLSSTNRFARIDADGLGSYNSNPESSESYQHIMYAPCFSFGDTSACTVRFETNGGSAVAEQSVANGSAVTSATTTKSGCEFVGWYTDAALTKPFVLGSTAVTSDITLYARWTEAESSVLDSYWLADAYKTTSGNAANVSGKVNNEDCRLNPDKHVVKNRAQILFDVSRLRAGDTAAKVAYTYYCLTDSVHLYTNPVKSDTGNSTEDPNSFCEFRIVNVGSHDNDGSALTFMMSTAARSVKPLGMGGWYSYTQTDMNKYLNSESAGNDLGSKLYSDIERVDKNCVEPNTKSAGEKLTKDNAHTVSESMIFWLASVSEMSGTGSLKVDDRDGGFADREIDVVAADGSQYQYFKYHGANNSNRDNGTISSMNATRSGYNFVNNNSDCRTNYVLWTRTVVLNGNYGNFFAYGEKGAINYDNCMDWTSASLYLLYAPCFCF